MAANSQDREEGRNGSSPKYTHLSKFAPSFVLSSLGAQTLRTQCVFSRCGLYIAGLHFAPTASSREAQLSPFYR